MKQLNLLLLTLFVSFHLYAKNPIPKRVHFVTLDKSIAYKDIKISKVKAMLQDQKDFLWIGTQEGLLKFNGEKFDSYTRENTNHAIPNNDIASLIQLSNGDIWIGTYGGLCIYNPVKEKFNTYQQKDLNFNDILISDFLEDKKKNLWMASSDGVYVKKKDSAGFEKIQSDIEIAEVTSIIEDEYNTVWFGSSKGLFYIDKKGLVKKVNSFENVNILSLALSIDKKDIYVGSFQGLHAINAYNKKKIKLKLSEEIKEDVIWTLHSDVKSGVIWAGGQKGLIKISGNRIENIHSYTNGVQKKYRIYDLFVDNAGTLWIGTVFNELLKYETAENRFETFRKIEGDEKSLSSNVILSFLELRNGNFWIGTDGGSINVLKNDKDANLYFDPLLKNDPLENSVILSMAEHPTKPLVYIATYTMGIQVFDLEKNKFVKPFNRHTTNGKMLSDEVRHLSFDLNGHLWGATKGGIILINPETRKLHVYVNDSKLKTSLRNDAVLEVKHDKKGNHYAATFRGVNISSDKNLKYFEHIKIPGKDQKIATTSMDKNGNLWIGTLNEGVFVYNPTSKEFIKSISKPQIPSNSIFKIEEDSQGDFWISSSNGLIKMDVDTYESKVFGVIDGLQDDQFAYGSSYKTNDGLMLFGGVNGFSAFYPEDIISNQYKPKLAIQSLLINNKELKPSNENSLLEKSILFTNRINLHYNQNNIKIRFVALNYTYSGFNQYKYQLEGLNDEWVDNGNSNVAQFSNLSPGKYTFKVIGSNNDGIWNEEPVSLDIIITPPFWQTWIFRLLVAIILVLVVVLIINYRTKQLEIQKNILEAEVKSRTNELAESNQTLQIQQQDLQAKHEELLIQAEEISKQRKFLTERNEELQTANSTINHQMQTIQDSIRYAENIQSAILPSKEELTIGSDVEVIFRPKDVVSGDYYWAFNHNGYQYRAVVDCTGHGVPGAFMSMLGYSILNKAINQVQDSNPAEMLEILRKEIYTSLRQEVSNNSDGMDIILMARSLENKESILFAGAKIPLVVWRKEKGEVEVLPTDKARIGGNHRSTKKEFNLYTTNIQEGDLIYLYTDGIVDQANQEKKKVGSKQMYELIASIGDKELDRQKFAFEQLLEEYSLQRDDVTLIILKA
ncbi:two-component regulator propeller domain-containing protein [Flammeovirga aprica]|uniref:SpoIIE family protein phosphatase n=1 Tax=Flammeovirga aprica JL-4 TaxID=694437 RepID=A0A7X9P2D3_9BACT|nr:two-component regulator propeller domain-containing protein [Flammeovirga aprica]NME67394.1 SpoIIE family protein phosphatase [Flammeovirga aprica JL-4]